MSSQNSIMIVEDDADIRENLRLILEDEGFQITEAQNGQEALDLLTSQSIPRPSLIFLDLMMPVMGGKKFLEEFSKISSFSDIPVFVLTASAEKFEHKTAGFMKKPLDMDALLAVAHKHAKLRG